MFLKDSVFSSILAQFQTQDPHPYADDQTLMPADEIIGSLDKLENNFAQSALSVVGAAADQLWRKLQGTKKVEDIDKASWNVRPLFQQLTWFLWRDGWQLGQEHGTRELSYIAGFSLQQDSIINFADDDEPVIKPDLTIKKRDRKLKVSKQLGNRVAAVPDFGIPLEKSVLQQAVENRTVTLAKDVDETTLKEIKKAIRGSVVPDAKLGRVLTPKEVEARINLALGRQVNRGNAPRTKIEKVAGGGFFSRAKLIARTELSGAYTTARIASFQAAGVTHVRWVSMEDLQRCPRCASRHGMVVALSDVATLAANPIPLHPSCRCIWTPVPDDDGGDRMKKDPKRSPGGRGLIPIAASWIAGSTISMASVQAAKAITDAQAEKQAERQKQKQLRNLILGAGAGALSLAALYFLVLKNPQAMTAIQDKAVDAITKKIVTEGQKEVIKQQQEQSEGITDLRPSISNSLDRNPNYVRDPRNYRTPRAILSQETLQAFPQLAASDVDLPKITIQDLMRLTGLSKKDAVTFKDEILRWLRERELNTTKNILALPPASEIAVSGIDINTATTEQLMNLFGLPQDKASKIRAYLDAGNKINNFADLAKVPGIGKRSAAKIAARMSSYRPNINTVPNTPAAAQELAAQLGIGPKLAQAILDERDQGGFYADMEELSARVKGKLSQQDSKMGRVYLGKQSQAKIASGVNIIKPPTQPTQSKQGVGVGEQEQKAITGRLRLLPPAKDGDSKKPVPSTSTIAPLTPSIIPASTIRIGNREIKKPPSPTPPPKGIADVDGQYQQLNGQVENYHASVAAAIPKKLRDKTLNAFARQDETARTQSQIYAAISNSVAQLPDEINQITAQITEIERAYTQFLNPVNSGFFDTANSNVRAINKQVNNLQRNLNKIQPDDLLEAINERVQELQGLRQEVVENITNQNTQSTKNQLASQINNLTTQLNRLDDSPAKGQLLSQIQQLADELNLERDRNIAAINNRIEELEKLSTRIGTDTSGVRVRIAEAKAQLQNLRSRLQKIPTQVTQLDELAQNRYRQSRKIAASQPKTAKKVANYRAAEAQADENLQKLTQAQQQASDAYQLQYNAAINNLSSIVERTQVAIEQDLQLLRLMSGQEGINWVLSKANASDGALQLLQRQAGIKSITTVEEAAKFRDYAMAQLRGNINAKVERLQAQLEYPQQLTNNFLNNAKIDAANLQEIQKQTVIGSQQRAAEIIKDMNDWEDALAQPLAGGKGNYVNPQVKQAKNQILTEVTDRRINQSQKVSDALADNQAWRSSLEKRLAQEPILEVNGKALTKTDLLGELQSASDEARGLHTINQIDITAQQSPETVARKQAAQLYRQRIDSIAAEMRQVQKEIGQIQQEISRRQSNIKPQPTGRLEAQKREAEQRLSNLMRQVQELDKNRGFQSYKLPLIKFSEGRRKEEEGRRMN